MAKFYLKNKTFNEKENKLHKRKKRKEVSDKTRMLISSCRVPAGP